MQRNYCKKLTKSRKYEFRRERQRLQKPTKSWNQIGALRQAISDNDADLVMKEAHSIKGGAANLTADDLSKVAFELENIGKSGTVQASTGILERLEKEFYRLDAFAKGQ